MGTDYESIYRERAADYDRLVSAEDCDGNLLPAIERVTPLAGANVVEVGVGTGRVTRLLVSKGALVIGFDRSEAMLAIARRRLAEVFADDTKDENVHPNTYAAHPVACAAALANLQIMEKDHLVENAEAMGARLLAGLRDALGKLRIVGEVRGRGLLVCAELVEPKSDGTPLDKTLVASLDRKAWDRGAIVYARGNVLRLAPPLCITASEVDQLVDVVAASVRDLDAEVAR